MSMHNRRSRSSFPVDKSEQVEQLTGKRKDVTSGGDAAIFGANVAVVFRGSACGTGEDLCEPAAKALKVDSPDSKTLSGRPLRRASLRARVSLTSTTASRRKSARLSQSFRPASEGSSMSQGSSDSAGALQWTKNRVGPTSECDRRLSLQPQGISRAESSKSCPRRASQQLQPPLVPGHGMGPPSAHRTCGGQPLDDVTSALLNDGSRRHSHHLSVETNKVVLDATFSLSTESSSISCEAPAAQASNHASLLSECNEPRDGGAIQPDVALHTLGLCGQGVATSQHSLNSISSGAEVDVWAETSYSQSSARNYRHSTDSDHFSSAEDSSQADDRSASGDDSSVNRTRLPSEEGGSSVSEIDVISIDIGGHSSELDEASVAVSTSCCNKINSWNSVNPSISGRCAASGSEMLTEGGSTAAKPQSCSIDSQEVPRSVTPDAAGPHKLRVSGACVRVSTSGSPLPPLTWADRHEVWQRMCAKDKLYKRSPNNLDAHPALHSRMRAILIDWICEVSEVYKLHRETFHLAVDYIDRYLLATRDVPKQQLQLLGVTCLFIAAKVEEIYPPKLSEFAYVTDGACQEAEIIEKELVVVKTLSWRLSPLTCTAWLKIHLQLLHDRELMRRGGAESAPGQPETEFVNQSFNGETFVQVCRLLDLLVLEVSSLQFAPSLISAAALAFFFRTNHVMQVSGYSIVELSAACRWMQPFAEVLLSIERAVPLKTFKNVHIDDFHNIQTKSVCLDDMDKVLLKMQEAEQQKQQKSWAESSSPVLEAPQSVLTPPKTDEKREGEGEDIAATSANVPVPPAAVVPYHSPVSFDA